MNEDPSFDTMSGRREFTLAALLAMLSGVSITISGCGGSSSSSPTTPTTPPPAGSKTGTVSANHGHVATINSAELAAGNSVTLNIRGSGDHDHTVSLSAAEVVQIRDGAQVAKASSSTDHNHTVTFN